MDAAYRLPILNDPHYRDLLCEMGGMFSIAYRVDDIHKRPWVGFQSWKASGRQVKFDAFFWVRFVIGILILQIQLDLFKNSSLNTSYELAEY